MKTLLLALLLGASGLTASASPFDFGLLRYAGLPAYGASRARIAQQLGTPTKVWRPHYECGGFSEAEQHQVYYELRYAPARFIGNAREGYSLDHVTLTPSSPLRYGQQQWTTATTLQQVQRLFGADATTQKWQHGTVLVTVRSKSDAGAHLIFKNGRLVEFELWTPC